MGPKYSAAHGQQGLTRVPSRPKQQRQRYTVILLRVTTLTRLSKLHFVAIDRCYELQQSSVSLIVIDLTSTRSIMSTPTKTEHQLTNISTTRAIED